MALTWASALAMQVRPEPRLLGLAFAGTLFVYTVDRLRDLERDRVTSPRRSAFVERFEPWLRMQVAVAALVALALGLGAGMRVVVVAGTVAVFGLLHRRLKHLLLAKPIYLTAAWAGVVVGMPAAHDPAARHVVWVALIVAGTVTSNVVLSNLRDDEGAAARLGHRRALAVAAINLLPVAALALLGPVAVRPLVLLPLFMAGDGAGFRPSEHYGALAVDGALLAGALGAAGWASAAAT
ncbi:MAG: hypothetical protein CL910_06400 [Deltaproteobacteria bacterium]|nr:hypothetical protein [Deltaproteobacteria bacterium]